MKRNTVVPTLAGVISLTLGAGLRGSTDVGVVVNTGVASVPRRGGVRGDRDRGPRRDVVIVDTLEPYGPGSFGEALDPEDCRPASWSSRSAA